jgi:hypothetical protein
MALDNSKIRGIILTEHVGLRLDLEELDALLEPGSNGAAAYDRARALLAELLHSFLEHLEHEERILRPILATVDAWGAARVDAMDLEHTQQRAWVSRLTQLDAVRDPDAWAREVRAFSSTLLADMDEEERTCLSAAVLRDDIVAIDAVSE